jgi:hypothetical protein
MAFRTFTEGVITPVAVADTANMTSGGFMAIQGGSSTQRNDIHEIYMGGQATSSAPSFMQLARDSTVGATLSIANPGSSDGALDPATAALAAPPVSFDTATTKPQRAATLARLNLSFNAFGGIVRWVAPPGQEFRLLGNAASLGEASLSAFTGGTPGPLGAHILFEPFVLLLSLGLLALTMFA